HWLLQRLWGYRDACQPSGQAAITGLQGQAFAGRTLTVREAKVRGPHWAPRQARGQAMGYPLPALARCTRHVSKTRPLLEEVVNIATEAGGWHAWKATSRPDVCRSCRRKPLVCQNHSFPCACGVSCTREAACAPVFCGQPPVENR